MPTERYRNDGRRWSTAKKMSHYLLSPISLHLLPFYLLPPSYFPPTSLLPPSYLPPISLLSLPPHSAFPIPSLLTIVQQVGERGRNRIHRSIEVAFKTYMLEAHQKINANLLVEVRSKNKVGEVEGKRRERG